MEDGDLSNLPFEAWAERDPPMPFKPDDNWLQTAPRDQQAIAVREWFTHRFCDPADNTPYNEQEGCYQFIHGGPHSPDKELYARFSRIVPDDVINEVVKELESEHGAEWAPIHYEPDDDDELSWAPIVSDTETLLWNLHLNLEDGIAVLTLQGDARAQEIATQLVYAQAISALENFLWETARYWIERDDEFAKRCITFLSPDQKTMLGDVNQHLDDIKNKVHGYLNRLVWHRWDKVASFYEKGLGVKIPSTELLHDALKKRHDIVHRCGRDHDGYEVVVNHNDVRLLSDNIKAFCEAIADALPYESSEPWDEWLW